MKKDKENLVKVKLNKPNNLILEDLIRPDLPFFVFVRQDDGSNSPRMTNGKRILKHLPALYYFIHMLLERQHSDIESLRLFYNKSFIKMFSRDIEPIKSKNDFRFIWGILSVLKVIEDRSANEPTVYRKSAMGYYFKLAKKYEDSPVIEHEVYIKESIYNKLNQKWNINTKQVIDLSKITINRVSAHQYQALRNINFDYSAAEKHLISLLSTNEIDTKKFNSCMIYISNIKNGRIYLTKSKKCNRYYTPVTNLPKIARPFIIDDKGKSLVELDYGSFNAFVVYKILNKVNPDFKSNGEKIAFETELDLYRRILSGGNFYMDFSEVFFPNDKLERDVIKNIVLRHWFNGRPNSRNKHRKHLLRRLPNISEIIDNLKSERFEDFSNIAMRMESELINDIVYKKFIDKYPDAIMFTIFDSFLVEQRYSTQLYSMMMDEGSKYFELNCFVNTK